ncbi:MAG: hypothetical protein OEX19_11270 [Gammaproteobacteria bacterium]|nr:hypothetical protein [Gammaproteobacteria bacterium]
MSNSNYLLRLYKGEIPLVVTYWIFGVLGNIIFIIILEAFLKPNMVLIVTYKYGIYLYKCYAWVVFVYFVFIAVCIWRSSNRYSGEKLWPILAKLIVISNLITMAYVLIPKDSETALKRKLEIANESLPAMISERTRIDRVYLLGSNIYYDYTLVQELRKNIDIAYFKKETKKSLVIKNCGNEIIFNSMEKDKVYVFVYHDKTGNQFAKVDISVNDCK